MQRKLLQHFQHRNFCSIIGMDNFRVLYRCMHFDCSVSFPLLVSFSLLTSFSLVLSVNLVFFVYPTQCLSLCCSPATLLKSFEKITSNFFCLIFPSNTLKLFEDIISLLLSSLLIEKNHRRLYSLFYSVPPFLSLAFFSACIEMFRSPDFSLNLFLSPCAVMLLRSISVDSWKRNRGS